MQRILPIWITRFFAKTVLTFIVGAGLRALIACVTDAGEITQLVQAGKDLLSEILSSSYYRKPQMSLRGPASCMREQTSPLIKSVEKGLPKMLRALPFCCQRPLLKASRTREGRHPDAALEVLLQSS